MRKLKFTFIFTAIISIVLSGIYFATPVDDNAKSECPYLKNKSELTCPYLNDKYGQTDTECPYLNGKLKSPSTKNESEKQQCPYLQKKESSTQQFKTIKNISS